MSDGKLIYKKMAAVMKDIGAIGKNEKNQAQGFKFRGVDSFVNSLYPALVRHGVFMAPRGTHFNHEIKDVVRSNGKAGVDKHVSIMMEYDFFAEDGSSVTVGPIPAEGVDSGDKATNKALSAALKYALIQTFSIPTEDMAEADFESPELGSSKKTITVTSGSTLNGIPTTSITTTSPTPVATVTHATTVEPLKKSSFRKTAAPTPAAAPAAPAASEEWS